MFQEDRDSIFILYRLCKRKQFEDRFEVEFKPLPITDSETVANRLALVFSFWMLYAHLGLIPFTAVMKEDARQEGGSAQCLGMADLQMLTPHSSWGRQGTLHVASHVFYTPHHSVFNLFSALSFLLKSLPSPFPVFLSGDCFAF